MRSGVSSGLPPFKGREAVNTVSILGRPAHRTIMQGYVFKSQSGNADLIGVFKNLIRIRHGGMLQRNQLLCNVDC